MCLDRKPARPHTRGMRGVRLRVARTVQMVGLGLSVISAGCRDRSSAPTDEPAAVEREPFLARRMGRHTSLRERGPSPASYEELTPPRGVALVHYPSGDHQLQAWLATPLGGGHGRSPALVYFHGDFAFGLDDFEVVRPFVDAGFVVMTPMLRGENGNPGDFELLWGEIDDARAAVEWLAVQPSVDRKRIYAFGHSVGGGVAAMLSLYPQLPLRITASCGGIYEPETFGRWAKSKANAELVRFDPTDPDETELRVLGPNLPWMVHRHIAYVGAEDPWFLRNASALEARAWRLGKPFEKVVVPGDHMDSLHAALEAFMQIVQRDV